MTNATTRAMQEADVKPGGRQETGQHRQLGDFGRLRVFARALDHGAGDQVAGADDGDVVQHDGGDDLGGVEADLEPAGQHAPQRAPSDGGDEQQRNEEDAGQAAEIDADRGGCHCADVELPLGADVPDGGAEGDGQTGRDDDQRRRLDEHFGDRAHVGERALPHGGEGKDGVVAADEENEPTDEEGDSDRSKRGQDRAGDAGALDASTRATRRPDSWRGLLTESWFARCLLVVVTGYRLKVQG